MQSCTLGRCSLSSPGGSDDAGLVAVPDAGTSTVDAGAVMVPEETWTWVPVVGTTCGNGSQTGVGLNLSRRSTDVLVFMQGGGACWNELTCSRGFATDLDGYSETKFAADPTKNLVIFNRANMNNPFRNASFVFIPYCTGDVHAGDTLAPYGIHHRGAANVRADLARLQATFQNTSRIWLTGVSAGGYGVQFNYFRFAEAFATAEVHALADSAQMVNPSGTLLSQFVGAWNTSNPPGCAGCTQDFTQVPGWLARTYPNRRFGLLAYSRDSVLAQFLGYQQPAFESATTMLLSAEYTNKPNLKYYVVDPAQPSHVLLPQLLTRTVSGVALADWVSAWANGTPGWENVRGL
jgi:hypothetical protein